MSGEVLATTQPLGELVEILSGFPFKSDAFSADPNVGTPLIRIRDIKTHTPSCSFIGDYDAAYLIGDGDIIIGMDGEFTAVRWQGGNALLNQRVLKIRSSRPDLLDEGYLFHRIQSDLAHLETVISGTTVKHLSVKDIRRLEWCLPPLDEQRRIAEVLRSVDEVIAASIATERAVRSIFHHRRIELIEGARGASPEILVADAIRKNRGHKLKKLQTDHYADIGQYPIVDQGAQFVCGYTDDGGAVWPYDLPVIVFGDHTRILKFVDFPFVIGADGTQCLTAAEGIRPRYLYYALQSLDLQAEGYARHFKLLKEKTIPVPTAVDQMIVEGELFSIESTLSDIRLTTQKLGTLKAAMSLDLLSGRVRVPA